MLFSSFPLAATLFATLGALAVGASPSPAALKEYKLEADGIRATFIPYGARMTSLLVPDRDGEWRDVNLGYTTPQKYAEEKAPSYFGAVIGRYANRIRNGTFTVNGEVSQVPNNDNGGLNALHGGVTGYDARDWTVVNANSSTVTFSLMDYGFEGFPGNVLALATYTLSAGKLTTVLTGIPLDKATPIMLTTHSFFNLGSSLSRTVLDDTLHLPTMSRIVGLDSITIPTGEIVNVALPWHADGSLDSHNFTSPRQIKDGCLNAERCGDGCVGIDNAYIIDNPQPEGATAVGPAQVIWTSATTGIRMRVHTNMPSIQIYTCNFHDGSVVSQLGVVEKYGCIAIEPQGWIDGINHPEWGHLSRQIFAPGTAPAVNVAEYVFDTVPSGDDKNLWSALGLGKQGFFSS